MPGGLSQGVGVFDFWVTPIYNLGVGDRDWT
jgi:hypothetical protein